METPRAEKGLVEYLADRDVECPKCGYNLRGLEQAVCPECSRVLRLAELRVPRGKPWAVVPSLIGLSAAFAFCLFGLARSYDLGFMWRVVVGVWIGTNVLVVLPLGFLAYEYGKMDARPAREIKWAAVVLAAALVAVGVVALWQ